MMELPQQQAKKKLHLRVSSPHLFKILVGFKQRIPRERKGDYYRGKGALKLGTF
jgi:hypothetical protein